MSKYNSIFLFIHDGLYCVHTGAGMTNSRLIKALVILGYGNKLRVCPTFTSTDNPDFSGYWFKEMKELVEMSGGEIFPVQNGSMGYTRYGDVTQWRKAAKFAQNIVVENRDKSNQTLVISCDTPFIDLIKGLSSYKNIIHCHVPRSTGFLHEPDNIARVHLEKENLSLVRSLSNTFIGASCSFMQNHLIKKYDVAPSKIIPFTNGILVDECIRYEEAVINNKLVSFGLDPEKPLIFSYGRAAPYKGFHILLEAVSQLEEKDIQLILVASTNDKNSSYLKFLHSLFEKLMLKGKIINQFDPFLPPIIQQAKNLSAIIVPSLAEPFGLVPIESFSNPFCLAPVIASNIGGLTAQVIDGGTGFIFKSGNATDLKNKLIKVMDLDINQKELLKQNAFNLVKKKFVFDQNISVFLDKLEERTLHAN